MRNPELVLKVDYPDEPYYEGTYFSLTCYFTADYPLDYDWTFIYELNNIVLPNALTYPRVDQQIVKHSLTNITNTLTFTKLNYQIDEGIYNCSLSNNDNDIHNFQNFLVYSSFNLSITSKFLLLNMHFNF